MTQPLAGDASVQPEAPLPETQVRRTLFALLILAAVACLGAPLFVDRIDRTPSAPLAGVMDLTGHAMAEQPVSLAGEWRLIWLAPGPQAGPITLQVPGEWRTIARPGGGTLPRQGRARFELTVTGLAPGAYTLFVPTVYAASAVSVDGRMVSQRGRVGDDAAATTSQWASHTVDLVATGDPVHIAIDVASFHQRDNGLETSPILGREAGVRRWLALQWARDLMLSAVLLVLGVHSLIIHLIRPADRASLFFGLSCLFYLAPMAMLGPENLVLLAAPELSFRLMLSFGYLSSIVAISVFVAYVDALFPKESNLIVIRALTGAFGLSFAWQAFALIGLGDTLLASSTFPLMTIATGLALIATLVIVARAALHGRSGAAVFLFGMGMVCIAFAIDAATMNGLLDSEKFSSASFVPLAILFLLFCHATVLAERWADAITEAEATATDLRRLIDVSASVSSEIRLEQLLDRIVRAASAFVNAERSSVFLFDASRRELWSIVAQGEEAREIRFDVRSGLAGAAFSTGETINIPDAYQDARFNPDVDARTGYRTQSILSMPLTARDGRRLGVMQALNRRDGRPFSQADAARLGALAAQAAIAVENATLFSEVLEAKTYNDSILGTMSNGVVTFDQQGAVASVNPAAARILDLNPGDAAGRSAQDILPGNEALLAGIAGVKASGEQRTLVDVDLQTHTGKSVAANIALTPLVRDEPRDGGDGVLMLVDDISDEKRLEGAMRRFMTQRVVDQVLQSEDLLFGSACRSSVLFADIRNFTSIAEQMSPRETVDMLNEIFTDIVDAVNARDGVLDKFMGDAVMAVFGAPIPGPDDAANAVESAIAMMRLVADGNARRIARNAPPLRLGIGVATGEVIAGTIGSPKRMDYTVIGDSVNLAARLQVLTKHYQVGIAVCEATAAAATAAGREVRLLDRIRVRGRDHPEQVYEILEAPAGAGDEDGDSARRRMLGAYRDGLEALQARDWAGAAHAFGAALAAHPGDRPSGIMLARARAALADPPDLSWDGVWPAPDAPEPNPRPSRQVGHAANADPGATADDAQPRQPRPTGRRGGAAGARSPAADAEPPPPALPGGEAEPARQRTARIRAPRSKPKT